MMFHRVSCCLSFSFVQYKYYKQDLILYNIKKIQYLHLQYLQNTSRQPKCQRICMCRSHQSVAELLGRSSHGLEKTLTQQLLATGRRGWGDTTPCTANWCKKKSHLGCLISFVLPMGFQNFVVINKIYPLKKNIYVYILYVYIELNKAIRVRRKFVLNSCHSKIAYKTNVT